MSIHGVLSIVNSFNSCLLFCRIVESRIEEDNIINFNLLYPLNKSYTGIQGFVNFTAKAIVPVERTSMSIHGVLSIVNSFNSCLLFCRIVESRIEEDNTIGFNMLYPLNKSYTGIQGFVNFTAKAINKG